MIELIAGFASHSLALVADAGHVFADVSGMALSIGAIWLANRPTSGRRSFGLYRLEIVASVLNAVLLLAVAAVILWEGIQRLTAPPEVDSAVVIVVATIALAANALALAFLAPGRTESLNVRGAYLEVLGTCSAPSRCLSRAS